MNKSIYLATDPRCWNIHRLQQDRVGGTESFFWRLRRWLMKARYKVYDPVLYPCDDETDMVIYSNVYDPSRRGNAKILRAGSWHATVHEPELDKIILTSEFMKGEMECHRAIVIPVPYDSRLNNFKGRSCIYNRIVSTANPNRWIDFAPAIVTKLREKAWLWSWYFAGGNRLYAQEFQELYEFPQIAYALDMIWTGDLEKSLLYDLLATANVWIYPNFEGNPETFCISVIEPAVLQIPVILPKREPFTTIFPEAWFAETPEEMAQMVIETFTGGRPARVPYDMERYSEEVIFEQWGKEIKEMI